MVSFVPQYSYSIRQTLTLNLSQKYSISAGTSPFPRRWSSI